MQSGAGRVCLLQIEFRQAPVDDGAAPLPVVDVKRRGPDAGGPIRCSGWGTAAGGSGPPAPEKREPPD